jgi:hypothetical protein
MTQATAQGRKELPNGEKATPPVELQLGWLLDWQGAIPGLGFAMMTKAGKALRVYQVFQKLGEKDGQKRMTPEDWEVVTSVLSVVEEWNAG